MYFVIQVPASTEEWSKVAEDFQAKWNYPSCIGAMDDNDVAIKQPPDSGSEF